MIPLLGGHPGYWRGSRPSRASRSRGGPEAYECRERRPKMLRTGIVVLLGVALLVAGVELAAESANGMLDGKTFSGTLGEKGEIKGDQDNYVFKDGTFRSTACDVYGFSAAAYTAKADGHAIAFE